MPRRETAAERRARPSFHEIAVAAAQTHGVCVRPLVMGTVNVDTGATDYAAVPCKSTMESQCAPCAKKARALRMHQCREGWHLDHEPVQPAIEPTEQQSALLRSRADLVAAYRDATTDRDHDREAVAELRAAVGELDTELRATGMRGTLPPLDPRPTPVRTRSTKRRHDMIDLPTRQVRKNTIGQQYVGKYRPSMFLTLTCDSYGPIQGGARSIPAPMITGVRPAMRSTSPLCLTGSSRTCGASWAGTSSISPPWNLRNAAPRTCTWLCAARSLTPSSAKWLPPPTTRCGGRTTTS
ncbi:hypothetical protein BZL30_7051 [Mycobacterium kansasii]|uniref:Uncharacterized protein n=1 Tax=Mycobacterium kansasii TaxID=1768 RepID=A0A1V3WPC2_MYCKA|nr:hypothetical protein BZL30_7051 [Mycobacterium kansasii]